MMSEANCIFCRIVRGEIPSRKVYEDEECLVFHDIHPVAPVHVLVIPKEHIDSLAALEDRHASAVGRMLVRLSKIAAELGSAEGFRLIANTGRIGRQDVYHLHFHVIGGPNPLPAMITKLD